MELDSIVNINNVNNVKMILSDALIPTARQKRMKAGEKAYFIAYALYWIIILSSEIIMEFLNIHYP